MIPLPTRSTRNDPVLPCTALVLAQRACSYSRAGWMAYARKLEAKSANQQQNIRTMSATIEDLRSSSEGWKETALDRLGDIVALRAELRSEEHTSELQSLMRISYAVFCLKKKKQK